ncbi:MAG: type II secretion system protein GspG [Bdellovibrionales bacterium]|nr:type II secretion system protein GspG [Bdellovibrionales bacterium]
MKEIQNFSFLDLFSTIGLFSMSLVAIFLILWGRLRDPEVQKAVRTAHVLSGQLVAGGVQVPVDMISEPTAKGDRFPASVTKGLFLKEGTISKDPWGRPFSYKFIFSEQGEPAHLLVWSYGPNGRQETRGRELAKRVAYITPEKLFMGDDVGIVRVLSPKLLAREKKQVPIEN